MKTIDKLLTITFILSISLVGFAASQGTDEKEFSYEAGSESGPEHWGELHKEWVACGKGRMQSPIDLSNERVQVLPHLGELQRAYGPSDAFIKNRGHDIMIRWDGGAGGVWLNGTEYALKQIHWHSPSEHTIDNVRYSLELHMVHENANKEIAVVGVLYSLGRPDPFLAKMEGYISKIQDMKGAEVKVGLVNPMEIKLESSEYYRYIGSLTTPPCTEGVVWTIIKKVGTVSNEQLSLLRKAVVDGSEMNARPKQPINDRAIGMYRPRKLRS